MPALKKSSVAVPLAIGMPPIARIICASDPKRAVLVTAIGAGCFGGYTGSYGRICRAAKVGGKGGRGSETDQDQ
jgi:hypothetical protein